MREVESFINSLPKDEQIILKWLREMIISADDRISEKLSYGVPYFSRNRRLFFLWPASAIPGPPEKKLRSPKVTFGFCYGNLLSNDQGLLVDEHRKQVFTIPISGASEISDHLLREIINEAILVDDEFKRKKKVTK
jgi:hypothetical protein